MYIMPENKLENVRIFVGWNNGCFVNSLDPNFQELLEDLFKQYGRPDIVEFREDSYA